ncbi:RHS repeat-associated core domain-containing protein [Myxococcus eversor]|uniref:RHS repeat-associated core domain-containing protein n=1 Tax=Myxococcus eversor TaxID=2709661 RepID=UPI0013D54F70|nr:RHS repeat-associated core domain-containing protein [Myxococcus eversor]
MNGRGVWVVALLGVWLGCGQERSRSEVASTQAPPRAEQVRQAVAGDVTPPAIAVSGVAQGASVRVAPTLTWTVTDQSATLVEAWLDGEPVASGVTVSSEGPHALIVRATDTMGLSTTVTRTFRVDMTAPVISISGVEEGEHSKAPAVYPNASATDVDAVSLSATLNGLPFTLRAPVHSQGRYLLVVTATDGAGNTASRTVLFYVDRTLPDVGFAGFADGDHLKEVPVTLEFFAEGTVPGGPLWPLVATATLDGQPITSPWDLYLEGEYTLVVSATDMAGNTNQTEGVLVIDTTPPVVTISGVTHEQEVDTAQVVPTFAASDNLSPSPSVVATLDGQPFASGTAVSAEGLHTLVVTATDLAGNETQEEVSFTLDRSAPVLTVSGVTNGGRYPSAIVTFSGSDLTLDSVTATLNGSPYVSGTTIAAHGAYTFTAVAVDRLGHQSSVTRTFSVDAQGPVIVVTGVHEGFVTKGPSVVISFSATDDSGGAVQVRATLDGEPFTSGSATTDSGARALEVLAEDDVLNLTRKVVHFTIDIHPPTLTVSGVPSGQVVDVEQVVPTFDATDALTSVTVEATLNGQPFTSGSPITEERAHTLIVVATDAAGNVTREEHTFAIDRTPPELTVSGVDEGSRRAAPVAIEFAAEDANLTSLTGTLDGEPYTSGAAITEHGPHVFIAVARDGAQHQTELQRSFRVDAEPPTITLSGVSDGLVSKAARLVPVFSATDEGTVTLSATLDTVSFTSGSAVETEGPHTLVITVADDLGNSLTRTVHFTLDRTPPTVARVSPADGTVTQEASLELVLQVTDTFSNVTVRLGATELSRGEDGRHRTTLSLEEGTNHLELTATDEAGNVTTHTVTVTRDSEKPNLTVTAPAQNARLPELFTEVMGKVLDTSSVTLTVNGQTVAVASDGSFSHRVPLTAGDNTLVVVATDVFGHVETVTRNVRASGAKPTLVVTSPPDDQVITSASLTVSGNAKAADPQDTVTVTVAGTAVTLSPSGDFSHVVSVSPGETRSISIIARDSYGATEEVVRTLTRTEADGGTPDAGTRPDAGGGASSDGGVGADGGSGGTQDAGPGLEPDPVLVVDAPLEGGVYGGPRFVVSGHIEGGTLPLRVTVQGVNMAVNGQDFTGALALVDGDHTLQFKVTDARGRTHAQTRAVAVDHTPPHIVLTPPTLPETWSRLSSSPYLLQGTAGDRHLTEVLVNGERARVIAGAFSSYVELTANTPKSVVVTAFDVAGNRSQETVELTLRSSAPRITILEPVDGSESPTPVVTVKVRVENGGSRRVVTIGTDEVTSSTNEYTAEVPLAHGENVIQVTAEDTEGETSGMMSSASVTVRYLKASDAPLQVTGVSPRSGEQGVEPDALVSVSFNKPILGTALSENFKVRVQGQSTPLPGGYSVIPGSQTVSFIARDPLPEGARLTVEVKQALAPEMPPGMGGDFSSDFTVRRPLTRVRGYVVDADYRPLPGVKVAMEGTSLTTVTGPDGNWTLFSPKGGEVVLRYEGGLTSEGASFPTLRRRLFVNEEADTLDTPLVLTAVDTASAQVVDARQPMMLRFANRHPDLGVDVPEDGLFFEDGMTRGLVTATELQPYALPLPMDGRAALGAVWQIGPAGLRLQKTVSVKFPNRANLPAGRLAMVLGHDPQRHVLKRVGFARVDEDRATLTPLAPLGLTSLEFIGYVPLNKDQHVAVATALGMNPDAGSEEDGEGVQGLMDRVRPSQSSEPLWKKLLTNLLVADAHAQFGGGLDMAAYNAFDTMLGMAVPGAVTGSVRAPLERQLELEVRAPVVPPVGQPASEQVVTLPYTLALDFRSRFESADPYDVANPETVLVKLTAEGPSGPLSEPTVGAWQSQGEGEAALAPRVALPIGKTTVTLSGLSQSTHRLMKFEAELIAEPADGGPSTATLRLRTLEDTFNEAEDEAVHSPVRFKNLRVTLTGPGSGSAGTTGTSGGYGIPVPGLMGGEMGISCTEVPTGPRMVERLGEDGVVHYTPTLNQFPICSQTFWLYPGATTRADILVDVRMLYGALTFVNRHGEPLALNCDPEAHSEAASTPGEFNDIALKDVKSTEVHFFRADDLEHPIATFAAGTANGFACTQGPPTEDTPHGYYSRVRTGPAARIRQSARERCRQLERQLGTSDAGSLSTEDQGYYDGNCRDNRTNTLRLNPGDRLVVFAVNHATGYSGMTSVTVPAINRVSRTETGGCQADDEAGGPLQVSELGEPMTLSRCTQSELGIPADLKLFPPEIDVRVARRMTPEGVQVPTRPSLIRHGGAATTRDDFLQMATHWRVRQLPEPMLDGGTPTDAGTPVSTDGGSDDAECTDAGFLPDGGICEPGFLRDRGAPGEELELFCSELPATSPQRLLGRCDTGTPRVVDVPTGVPPLAGRLVQVTQTAVEQPVVVAFPVRPGRHTASVQASLTYQNESGAMVSLSSLSRANYYLHVVGHPMYERDRNDDGFLQPDEVNAPPPNFCEPGECQDIDGEAESEEEHPDKLPKWAVGLKNVYRHREADGSALERYDRAREHEFRVLELGKVTVTAQTGDQGGADAGSADAGRVLTGLPRPEATDDDVAYQFLIDSLQEPDLPGRAGTVSGEYRLRLGTDDFGIECPIVIEDGRLTGTCDGEFLPEVLSAADILYFELYLSGNADNVLYRFNFHGISPRTDFVTAGSEDTLERSMARSTPSSPSLNSLAVPAVARPISVKAMAHFAIEPDTLTNGIIRICEGPDCNASTLLKAAELRYTPNYVTGVGSYQVVRYLDEGSARVKQPLIQLPKPGANGARRFALPLTNDLGRMQDMPTQGRELFLVIQPDAGPSGASAPVKMALGEPVGRYTFVNARAASQTVVEGVNLAGGHLSTTYEDFSVPHLAESASFSRTFNNQSNEVSPLGVGWSHAYEGFVVEEELGRYIVVLSGQSYDFPSCDTVNPSARSASDCKSDKSHGGRLVVNVDGAEFKTPQGMVYRFKTPSVIDPGIPDQRRWVLTEFSDGQGKDSPKQGWTTLTYAPDSDRVVRVSRSPGAISLAFEYKDADGPGATQKLQLLARTQGLKLLSAVGLYMNARLPLDPQQPPVASAAIHRVQFEHDGWGNLLRARRQTGLPHQAWVYQYAPPPDTSGYSRWRLVNELRTARFQLTPGVAPSEDAELTFFDQWVANYASTGTSSTYKHVPPGEVIDSSGSTGRGPRPYLFVYEGSGRRKVTRPDGVHVAYTLTSYGSAASITMGTYEHKTVWRSDGQISPEHVTLPNKAQLGYSIDSAHRLLSLKLEEAPPATEGFQDTFGDGAQPELLRQTFTFPVNQQFGIPDQRITPAQSGTQAINTRVTAEGQVEGITVLNNNGTTAMNSGSRSFAMDGTGTLTEETDALAQQIAYSELNALGLPQRIALTNPNAGGLGLATLTRRLSYDTFGRVVEIKEAETGAEEAWQYDSQGRITRHFIKGTPSQEWTYTYTPGHRRMTVQESLTGSGIVKTLETWEVFEGDEAGQGVFEEERTPFGPPGLESVAVRNRHVLNGRLVSTTDAVGVERAYDYDVASGWMTGVRIVNAGTTQGPSNVDELRYQNFDSNGKPRAVVDQNELLTRIGYDFLGRAVYWDYTGAPVVSGDRSSEEWRRNFHGDVYSRAFGNRASSHALDIVPDALGRVLSTKTNLSGGSITSVDVAMEYDGSGRVTRRQDHVMATDEHFEYHDALGRLTRYTRTMDSGSGPLDLEETRRYADWLHGTTERRKVTITRTIGRLPGSARVEEEEEYSDVAGRLMETVRTVGGVRASTNYTYNSRGQPLSEVAPTDGDGTEATTFHYDVAGNLYRKDEPGDATNPAAVTEFFVDGEGRVVRQKGPHPDSDWRYTYDAFGQVTSRELVATGGNAVGARWAYSYGLKGKPGADGSVPDSAIEETDPLGYKSYRYFNARYQLLKEVREDTRTVAGGGTTTNGNTTTTTYAYAGPWLQKQVVTERTEGGEGSPTVRTLERKKFDDRGRALETREHWQSGSDSYEYVTKAPWTGRTVSVLQTGTVSASPTVSLPSRQFEVETNSLGQVVARTQGGLTDSWSYDAAGLLAEEHLAGQPLTSYMYDQGLLTDISLGAGAQPERTLMSYRLDGRLKSVKDPSDRVRAFTYGPRGLLVREWFGKNGESTETNFSYDAGGFIAKVWRDPANPGDAWEYKHGPLGEVLRVTPPGVPHFSYEYDASRRLISINRPPGGVPSETFEYDYLGRTLRRNRGSSEWLTSWENGVRKVTSPNNAVSLSGNDRDVVKTLMDGRGRPIWKSFTAGASSSGQQDVSRIVFAYDALDALVQANEERGSQNVLNSFHYDDRARITRIQRGKDDSTDKEDWVEFSYVPGSDLLHRRMSGLLADGPRLEEEFGYDNLGRINSVRTLRGGVQIERAVAWEPGGELLSHVADDEFVERKCYDGRGWLKAIRTATPDLDVGCSQTASAPMVAFQYTYDVRGNRIREDALVPNDENELVPEFTEYGYDQADRLTGVRQSGGAAVLYKLAADGTRLGARHASSHVGSLSTEGYEQAASAERRLVYAFNEAGGLTSIDDLAQSGSAQQQAAYFTDGSGRVRRAVRPSVGRTDYDWDVSGRLAQVRTQRQGSEGTTETTTQYRYGFDGLRRSRTTGTDKSRYVWAGEELVEEQLAGGSRLHQEVLGGLTLSSGDERVLHDGLGSAVGRVTSEGVFTGYRYDAWGNYRDGAAPSSTQASIGYTGHSWDADSGLTYAQQRWYDSDTGRFLSEDPVGPSAYLTTPNELNPWLYARGNPLTFTDPDGRGAVQDTVGACYVALVDDILLKDKSDLSDFNTSYGDFYRGCKLIKNSADYYRTQNQTTAAAREWVLKNEHARAGIGASMAVLGALHPNAEGDTLAPEIRQSYQMVHEPAMMAMQVLELRSIRPMRRPPSAPMDLAFGGSRGAGAATLSRPGVAFGPPSAQLPYLMAQGANSGGPDDPSAKTFGTKEEALEDFVKEFRTQSKSKQRQGTRVAIGGQGKKTKKAVALGSQKPREPGYWSQEMREKHAELNRRASATENLDLDQVPAHPLGVCGEQHTANALCLMGEALEDIEFTKPISPMDGKFVPVCKWCQQIFRRDQFPPGTLFE